MKKKYGVCRLVAGVATTFLMSCSLAVATDRVVVIPLHSNDSTFALEVDDEGVPLDTAVTKINFTGLGVTASLDEPHTINVTEAGGAAPVDSIFSRTGTVVAKTGDYTATQVGLGNVQNVDQTNADNITSGTVADARVAATIARVSEIPKLTSELTNDSGFLTNYSETDPVFLAHPAFGVTAQRLLNWDDAFSWGNHALAGYLTSFTESDPVFIAWDKDYADLINTPDLSVCALKSNVLELDNTTSFTPDADYEPATKLYVDSAIPTLTGLTGNIQTTGTIKGRMEYGSDISTATATLDTTELNFTAYHVTVSTVITLDAAADAGYGSQVNIRVRDAAENVTIRPQTDEKINMENGAAKGGGPIAEGTGITAIGISKFVTLVATTDTDAAGTDGWEIWGNNGFVSE